MLSKTVIMLRVVSERGLQQTPRSKSDFAPGLVILRAIMMLKLAPCPCLVFSSRLVQNSCICTISRMSVEWNSQSRHISQMRFSWLWLQRRASCPPGPRDLGRSALAGLSRQNGMQVLLRSRVHCNQQGLRVDQCQLHRVERKGVRRLIHRLTCGKRYSAHKQILFVGAVSLTYTDSTCGYTYDIYVQYIYMIHGRRRSDLKQLRLPNFQTNSRWVPVTFKHVFTGFLKNSNKISWE